MKRLYHRRSEVAGFGSGLPEPPALSSSPVMENQCCYAWRSLDTTEKQQ